MLTCTSGQSKPEGKQRKFWFHYIKAFLFWRLDKKFSNFSYKDDFHKIILHVMVNARNLRYASPQQIQTLSNVHSVTRPKGNFTKVDRSIIRRVEFKKGKDYKCPTQWKYDSDITDGGFCLKPAYTWTFRLDENLRLNISVEALFIPSISVNCFHGNFTLLNYLPKDIKEFLQFCRKHPVTNIFSISNKLDIIMTVTDFVDYSVQFSYFVIDSHQIVTYYINSALNFNNISSYFPSSNNYMHKLQIQTVKYSRLSVKIIKSKTVAVTAFDGPGTASKMITPTAKSDYSYFFVTSTFQCVIIINGTEKDFSIKHSTINNTNISDLYVTNSQSKNFTYSSDHGPNILLMKFQTDISLFVNISINDISYKGPTSSICDFGGLASYHTNDYYEHISTICTPHDGVYTNRNIYSKSYSEILLVFYSYKEYSQIEIDFKVSVTNCEPVPIDWCVYNPSNAKYTSINFKKNTARYSRLSNTLKHNIEFEVQDGKCVIMQLKFETDETTLDYFGPDKHMSNCSLLFEYDDKWDENTLIEYNFTGFLQGLAFHF